MTTQHKPRSEYTGTCADLPNKIRVGNCEPTEQMTPQRIAELEAEVMRLREALENHSGNYKLTKDECRKMDALLSAPFTPTELNELIEKVERRTIERCVAEARLRQLDGFIERAIRALPVGQIKLEELLK